MILPEPPRRSEFSALPSISEPVGTPAPSSMDAMIVHRKHRVFETSSTATRTSTTPGRSTQAPPEALAGSGETQSWMTRSCPYGCGNGCTGCGSVEPSKLDNGYTDDRPDQGTFIEARDVSSSAKNPGTTTTGAKFTAKMTTKAVTRAVPSPASTITSSLATPAPTCPAANLHPYTDNYGIAYTIKCGTDNLGSASKIVKVLTGGYGQCFSVCSTSGDCVGFTYTGNDAGTCYLRSTQNRNADVVVAASTSVTCYKIDAKAVASSIPSTQASTSIPASAPTVSASPSAGTHSSSSPVGSIAGGVIGGIAAIALIVALIVFAHRRHKKNTVKQNVDETSTDIPAMTEPHFTYVDYKGHHRSGSTANDFFSIPVYTHTRQRSMHRDPRAGEQDWV